MPYGRTRRAYFLLNCLIWLLSGGTVQTVAQKPDSISVSTEYLHHAWTKADGLPNDRVQDILQTEDGYLWLATQNGLARFDGLRFVVFDLSQDKGGGLWIGTANGLLYLRDQRFRRVTDWAAPVREP
jgi:ligand-binding sensor domain-containing protein